MGNGLIVDALRSIPPEVRKWMMLGLAAAVLVVQVAQILDAPWDFDKIWQVVALVGGYLGIQGAANLRRPELGTAGEPFVEGTVIEEEDQPPFDPSKFNPNH